MGKKNIYLSFLQIDVSDNKDITPTEPTKQLNSKYIHKWKK